MEFTETLMRVLASCSLWLTVSGLVLWLGLRSRLRLSPATRAAASMLIVLQGWIWVGIPVQIESAWINPHAIGIPAQKAALIDAAEGATPLQFDSGLLIAASLVPDV